MKCLSLARRKTISRILWGISIGALTLWALAMLLPQPVSAQAKGWVDSLVIAKGGGGPTPGQGGCYVDITQCGGGIGPHQATPAPGSCMTIDDGNPDDPPFVPSFDGDKDDAQVIANCPGTAQAPPGPPPPTKPACTPAPPSNWANPDDIQKIATTATWLAPARGMASKLFQGLFVFEIFMIGLQAVLFRDNLSHLFSTFAFKTFVTSFFIYLISNADTVFPPFMQSFRAAGTAVGQANPGMIFAMFAQATKAAELFFCAAMTSHITDNWTANLVMNPYATCTGFVAGTGDGGCQVSGTMGHITFEFLVQGLGMIVIGSMGVIFLSWALITAETYIVMLAGVFFLGFSSTRLTLPYTHGYFGYTFNVGVKMFTFWIVIAIEQAILMPMLLAAGQGLLAAANIPYGTGAEMYLIPAGVSVAQIVAMALLTWFLPNIAGRMVTTQSALAAARAVSTLASSLGERPTVITAAGDTSLPAPAISFAHTSMPLDVTRATAPKEDLVATVNPPFNGFPDIRPSTKRPPIAPPPPPPPHAAPVFAAAMTEGPTISGTPSKPGIAIPITQSAPYPDRTPIVVPVVLPDPHGTDTPAPETPPATNTPEETPSQLTPHDPEIIRPTPTADAKAPSDSGSIGSPGFSADLIRRAPKNSAPLRPTATPNTVANTVPDTMTSGAPIAGLNTPPLRPTATPNVANTATDAVTSARPAAGLNTPPLRPTATPNMMANATPDTTTSAAPTAGLNTPPIRPTATPTTMANAMAHQTPAAGLNAPPLRPTTTPTTMANAMANQTPAAGLNAPPLRPTTSSNVMGKAAPNPMTNGVPAAGLNTPPLRPTPTPNTVANTVPDTMTNAYPQQELDPASTRPPKELSAPPILPTEKRPIRLQKVQTFISREGALERIEQRALIKSIHRRTTHILANSASPADLSANSNAYITREDPVEEHVSYLDTPIHN